MFSQCFLSKPILIITTFDEQVTAKQLEPLITPRYYHACATYNLGHTQVLMENWDHKIHNVGNHEHWFLQFLAVVGGESVQQELDSTEVIKDEGSFCSIAAIQVWNARFICNSMTFPFRLWTTQMEDLGELREPCLQQDMDSRLPPLMDSCMWVNAHQVC